MTKYKISKELINAVLDEDIKDIYFAPNGRFFETWNGAIDNRVNIDSFFFKCKDWAYNKGYYLASNRYSDGACCQYFTEDSRECDECGEVKTITIHADSEQQAVFNVCQCILENKTIKFKGIK